MIDLTTHQFKTNGKGLFVLLLLSGCLVGALAVLAVVLIRMWWLVLLLAAGCFAELYYAWRNYLYARRTTLTIDLRTYTLTYRHKESVITFKPTDVAHWYGEVMSTGRYAMSHAYIVLHSGETLYIHAWLYDGNHYFRYNHSAPFFIDAHHELLFPTPELTPRFRFLFPPRD